MKKRTQILLRVGEIDTGIGGKLGASLFKDLQQRCSSASDEAFSVSQAVPKPCHMNQFRLPTKYVFAVCWQLRLE